MKPQHSREHVAQAVTDFLNLDAPSSLRRFSHERGIPPSTLHYWLTRYKEIPSAPETKAFFESPAGLAFLHLMLISLHVCFTKVGAASVRNVSSFLIQTGLDHFVAASVGSQQELSKRIDQQIVCFGQEQTRRLAESMPKKLICVAEDETFHPDKMCLVVIEPVSNFILLETYADKRDSETWTRLLAEAVAHLNVEVVWQTSDEARGLLHHAKFGLEAQHAPDLFHIQQEIGKGASRALNLSLDQAQKRHQELMNKAPVVKDVSGGKLRMEPNHQCQRQQIQAGMALAQAYANRARVKQARRQISQAYHPYDLLSGKARDGDAVTSLLQDAFKAIKTATCQLGECCHKRIEKARRLIPEISATVTHFFILINVIVDQAFACDQLRKQLKEALIPGFYLQAVAEKEKDPKRRELISRRASTLLLSFHQRAGPFAKLSDDQHAHLKEVAQECAGIYQRSSSCVEGRNAHLARYHRGFHRLGDERLQALTVIHNYFVRRPDNTTAAERFFKAEHDDLLDWLVKHLPLPARPRNRKTKTKPAA